MRALPLVLCLGTAVALRGLSGDLSTDSQGACDADLKSCNAKYEALLKKYEALCKICPEGCPKPTTTTTTLAPEPVAAAPQEVPATPAQPKPIAKERGEPAERPAAPIYKRPMPVSGRPDNEKGYDYINGGDNWGGQCKGAGQSPVDFPHSIDIPAQTKGVLWFDYHVDSKVTDNSVLDLTNAGHDLHFNLFNSGYRFGGVKKQKNTYKVYEVEFHTPSEHTIDGRRFPFEAQIMHKDDAGKLLAVSVMFEEGKNPNQYLVDLLKGTDGKLPSWSMKTAAQHEMVKGKVRDAFNFEHLLPYNDITAGRDLAFYNYEGSLTQPPCTTGVDWWVLANPMEATKEQLKTVATSIFSSKSMPRGNARNTQSLGGRTLSVGHVGFGHAAMGHRNGRKSWPRQGRGYNTQDHPHLKAKKAHWSDASSAGKDKYGNAWKSKNKNPVVPSDGFR